MSAFVANHPKLAFVRCVVLGSTLAIILGCAGHETTAAREEAQTQSLSPLSPSEEVNPGDPTPSEAETQAVEREKASNPVLDGIVTVGKVVVKGALLALITVAGLIVPLL